MPKDSPFVEARPVPKRTRFRRGVQWIAPPESRNPPRHLTIPDGGYTILLGFLGEGETWART